MKIKYILLILLFVSITGHVSSQNLNDGLVLHYNFNGSLNDSGPNLLHAIGLHDYGPDRFGNSLSSLQLNGVNQYLSIGHNPLLNPPLPISFSFWINYEDPGTWNHVFSTNYFSNGYAGAWVQLSPTGKIAAGFGDGEGCICPADRQSFASIKELEANEWYFIVITIDYNNDYKLFINACEEPYSFSGSGLQSISFNNQPANLGRSNSTLGNQYFKGRVDDFRFWNRELSEIEIQQLITENVMPNNGPLEFLTFSISDQISETKFDYQNHRIEITMPCDSDLSNLVPSFSVPPNITATIDGLIQESSKHSVDFTDDVVYTLIRENECLEQSWTIEVHLDESTAEEILKATTFHAISIENQIGPTVIDTLMNSVFFDVKCSTNIRNLALSYTVSENSTVQIENKVLQTGSSIDFTNPVKSSIVNTPHCAERPWTLHINLTKPEETDFMSIQGYFIPNVITPNGDQANDFFKIGEQLLGANLKIYNRYGIEIYSNSDYQNEFSGSGFSEGEYYYTLQTGCYPELIKGWLKIMY